MSFDDAVSWSYENYEFIFMFVGVLISLISLFKSWRSDKRSLQIQREIKNHSAPKPFLVISDVYILTEEDGNFCTTVEISNGGIGLAKEILISGNYIAGDQAIKFQLNKIPLMFYDKKTSYNIRLFCSCDYPKEFEVTIAYESDSGFARKTKWKYESLGNGRDKWYIMENN